MVALEILYYPDPRLRSISRAVDSVDDEVRKLVDDMLEIMYAVPGIGLAAIQVNVLKRVVVVDVSDDKSQPLTLINPEILALEGEEIESEEGCLSVPGIYENVKRPEWCGSAPSTAMEIPSRWMRKVSSPPVSSMRSTTSMASCL